MKVYLDENKLFLLKESDEEVTFYKFFTEVKNFIQDLLDDPIGAKPSSFFSTHGISRSELLNKLLDRDIVTKKENITEPNDADGKITSRHSLQYKVPRKNFEQKINRLYSYFFENEKGKINESAGELHYDSVAVFIFCRDNEDNLYVLAGKRRGHHEGGKYNVPTGAIGDVFFHESSAEAAARETKEESGLIISPTQLKDLGDEEYVDYKERIMLGKNYMTVLNGTIDDNMPGAGDGENDRFEWIPVERVDLYDWAFGQDKKIYNITNSL